MAETTNLTAGASPQGQPATSVEAAQPAAPQAETTDVSSKFAHLARKEKAFRQQQREFQAQKQAWEAERAKFQPYVDYDQQLTKDPIGKLAEKGITPDQLASLLLNQGNPQEANLVFQLQQENKQLLERLDKIDKRFEENETSAVAGALKQIGYQAKILVDSDPDRFEMISKAGEDGIEAVKAYCKLMWDEDGVEVDTEKAAELVEQELLDRTLSIASAKKVAAKLQPSAPAEPAPLKPSPQASKTQQTTSLNSQTLQPGSRPARLTEKERIQRAILAAQGKL